MGGITPGMYSVTLTITLIRFIELNLRVILNEDLKCRTNFLN